MAGKGRARVNSLEISTMLYPTEDPSRVLSLLKSLSESDVRESKFTSHYGYSFKVLTVTVKKPKQASEELSKILSSMDDYDFSRLIEGLKSHLDGRTLFIRIDKQEAYLGRIRLFENDPGGYIRVKASLSTNELEEIKNLLKEMRVAVSRSSSGLESEAE